MTKHVTTIDIGFGCRYRWRCSCGARARVWQDSAERAASAGATHVTRKAQGSLFPGRRRTRSA